MANPPYSPRTRPPSVNPPPADLSIDPGSHRNSLSASRGTPSPVSQAHGHHRASWSQDLRGIPASPHRARHPSVSHQALHEMLSNPPIPHNSENDPFAGRDWKSIAVGEIVDPEEVRWVQETTSVEEATSVSRPRSKRAHFIGRACATEQRLHGLAPDPCPESAHLTGQRSPLLRNAQHHTRLYQFDR